MEQKRFFPKIILELVEELIFLMPVPMLQDQSSNDEVDDVRLPGGVTRDGEEMLVWKYLSDVLSYEMWRRDKLSATEFSLPFLSFISKSNS